MTEELELTRRELFVTKIQITEKIMDLERKNQDSYEAINLQLLRMNEVIARLDGGKICSSVFFDSKDTRGF